MWNLYTIKFEGVSFTGERLAGHTVIESLKLSPYELAGLVYDFETINKLTFKHVQVTEVKRICS